MPRFRLRHGSAPLRSSPRLPLWRPYFYRPRAKLQAIYVNGHVLTACLILGFFSIPEDQPRLATLLRSALAVGVAVSRVEGVLFAILMLALEPVVAVTRWRRIVPATAVALAATFLLGHVAFNLAAVLDIINPRIAWTLIAIGWLYLVFLLVLYGFDLDWLLEHLRRLTLAAIIMCSVLAIVWNPEHMMMVFYNLGSNMMLTGGWGIVWPAIFPRRRVSCCLSTRRTAYRSAHPFRDRLCFASHLPRRGQQASICCRTVRQWKSPVVFKCCRC